MTLPAEASLAVNSKREVFFPAESCTRPWRLKRAQTAFRRRKNRPRPSSPQPRLLLPPTTHARTQTDILAPLVRSWLLAAAPCLRRKSATCRWRQTRTRCQPQHSLTAHRSRTASRKSIRLRATAAQPRLARRGKASRRRRRWQARCAAVLGSALQPSPWSRRRLAPTASTSVTAAAASRSAPARDCHAATPNVSFARPVSFSLLIGLQFGAGPLRRRPPSPSSAEAGPSSLAAADTAAAVTEDSKGWLARSLGIAVAVVAWRAATERERAGERWGGR